MAFTHRKYYLGSISSKNFYYKNAIFSYYQTAMAIFCSVLPAEIIDIILSYVCSSLSVFAANNTIYYINPRDNSIIKTLPSTLAYNYGRFDKFIYAVSDDGMTIYCIRNDYHAINNMVIEYLCEEQTDPHQPSDVDTTTNRYMYCYNYRNELATPVMNVMAPTILSLSQNGDRIATVIKRDCPCIAIYVAKTKALITEIRVEDTEMHHLNMAYVSLSPNNNIVMAIYFDGSYTICLWDISTGAILFKHTFAIGMFIDNKIVWNPSSTKFALPLVNEANPQIDYYSSSIVFGTVTNNTWSIHQSEQVQGEFDELLWITNEKFAYNINHNIFISDGIGQPFVSIPNSYNDMVNIYASNDGHLIVRHHLASPEADDEDDELYFDVSLEETVAEPDVLVDILSF